MAGIFVLGLSALAGLFLSARIVGAVRDLPGGYRLELSTRDGAYRVHARDGTPGSAGVFEGTIEHIGWDERLVLAQVRRANEARGWFVLDTTTGAVRGPLSEVEIANDPVLSRIPKKREALENK